MATMLVRSHPSPYHSKGSNMASPLPGLGGGQPRSQGLQTREKALGTRLGGGGGVLNKAAPRGPTPYLFGRKDTPFIYLFLKEGNPCVLKCLLWEVLF